MMSEALNEVLREYIDDGGSPEVADQANKDLDAMEEALKAAKEYRGAVRSMDRTALASKDEFEKRLARYIKAGADLEAALDRAGAK